MTEIADIKDRDSFKAWLEETNQPRKVCVALAARAASRVLPVVWAVASKSGQFSVLPILRATLVAGVAGLAPRGVLTDRGHASALLAADAASRTAVDSPPEPPSTPPTPTPPPPPPEPPPPPPPTPTPPPEPLGRLSAPIVSNCKKARNWAPGHYSRTQLPTPLPVTGPLFSNVRADRNGNSGSTGIAAFWRGDRRIGRYSSKSQSKTTPSGKAPTPKSTPASRRLSLSMSSRLQP